MVLVCDTRGIAAGFFVVTRNADAGNAGTANGGVR